MDDLINEIKEEYLLKKVKIIKVDENDMSVTLHVISYFNHTPFIEDLQISKKVLNKNMIRDCINQLVMNSCSRYLRGDYNVSDKI